MVSPLSSQDSCTRLSSPLPLGLFLAEWLRNSWNKLTPQGFCGFLQFSVFSWPKLPMYYFLVFGGRTAPDRCRYPPTPVWWVWDLACFCLPSETGGLWSFPPVHTWCCCPLTLCRFGFVSFHGNAINILSALPWEGQRSSFSDSGPLWPSHCSWRILTPLVPWPMYLVIFGVWAQGSAVFSDCPISMSVLNSWGCCGACWFIWA